MALIKSIVCALLMGALTLPSVTEAYRWVQVWNDEFDGNQVDRSKWNFEMGRNQANNEQQLNTAGKFSIQYGKFEMRAKLPQGQGMWPAFWLLGENIGNVGWPACGEIDIMELVGKDPQNVYASLHAPSYDTTRGYHLDQGFAGDFHTYGVNWQPEQIDFYVDGNTYLSVNKNQSGGHWPFTDGKFFIILNLAVGGFWPGNPDGSTHFPQQYVVDYVRVWEIDWSLENEKAQFLN